MDFSYRYYIKYNHNSARKVGYFPVRFDESISNLQSKKIALEDLVRQFENNNEEYLKINQTVKDKVSSILSDGKGLSRLALYSLIESIRNEPIKYSSLICYHKNNNISLPGPPASTRTTTTTVQYHHKITLLSITPLCLG